MAPADTVNDSSSPVSARSSCSWLCPCPPPLARHRAQREERREQLVEQLVVAPVLDQRHAQRRPQRFLVGQHTGLGGSQHRIGGLGYRHADAEQPQQADEPVQAAYHRSAPLSQAVAG